MLRKQAIAGWFATGYYTHILPGEQIVMEYNRSGRRCHRRFFLKASNHTEEVEKHG